MCLGDEKSGKSTLIGVLLEGTLDDGDGEMRENTFTLRPEVLTG